MKVNFFLFSRYRSDETIASVQHISLLFLAVACLHATFVAGAVVHLTATNVGRTAYLFDVVGTLRNPSLRVQPGDTLRITCDVSRSHPTALHSTPFTVGNETRIAGVANQGATQNATLQWVVPLHGAPRVVYYQCERHSLMSGAIFVGAQRVITRRATSVARRAYRFDGDAAENPPLHVQTGDRLRIIADVSRFHPTALHSEPRELGNETRISGVINQGATQNATLQWDVPFDAPAVIFLQCERHRDMVVPVFVGARLVQHKATNEGRSAYFLDDDRSVLNPPILVRIGDTLRIEANVSSRHPTAIHSVSGQPGNATRLLQGVTGQGATQGGIVEWVVPYDAPEQAFLVCERHTAMACPIVVGGGQPPTPTNPNRRALVAHAVLMTLAFAVLLPLGVSTSAFLPYKLVIHWLPLHAAIQVSSVCMILAGFGCILYYVESESGLHFVVDADSPTRSAHPIFGMIIIAFIFAQMCLGIFSELNWRYVYKKSGAVPMPKAFPEKTHRWAGRLLLFAGLVQLILGLVEAREGLEDWVFGLYAAWIALIIIFLAILYTNVRKILREKKQQSKPRNADGTLLTPQKEREDGDDDDDAQASDVDLEEVWERDSTYMEETNFEAL